MDGHTKRENQVVQYMLWTYVMQQPSKWEDYLHLVEFSYNNDYHISLKMIPFELFYRSKYMTPFIWGGLEEKLILLLDMLK